MYLLDAREVCADVHQALPAMVVLVPLRLAMFFLLLLSAQLMMLWWRWMTPSGVQPNEMVQAERKLPYRHTFARYLLPT